MKYRKKPVVIEAVQFLPDIMGNAERITNLGCPLKIDRGAVWIETLEGDHMVTIGDFIIRGIKGEFYPCKNDIFLATYEPVKNEELSSMRSREAP